MNRMTARRCPSRYSRAGCRPGTPSCLGCGPSTPTGGWVSRPPDWIRDNREVLLANGDKVPYDRLLIATGVRSRAWFNPEEAKLKGLFTLRTSDDAAELQAGAAGQPKRVLIVGAGFIGSEIASVCRDLGLDGDGRGTVQRAVGRAHSVG